MKKENEMRDDVKQKLKKVLDVYIGQPLDGKTERRVSLAAYIYLKTGETLTPADMELIEPFQITTFYSYSDIARVYVAVDRDISRTERILTNASASIVGIDDIIYSINLAKYS